jgi:hypothetical protein
LAGEKRVDPFRHLEGIGAVGRPVGVGGAVIAQLSSADRNGLFL